jgi:hypothetical protein
MESETKKHFFPLFISLPPKNIFQGRVFPISIQTLSSRSSQCPKENLQKNKNLVISDYVYE